VRLGSETERTSAAEGVVTGCCWRANSLRSALLLNQQCCVVMCLIFLCRPVCFLAMNPLRIKHQRAFTRIGKASRFVSSASWHFCC